MARTQEERKAETRARLLSAAADLFARKGFHAVSAEAVADAADRTTGALYSHFGGKDGLLLALVEEWKQAIADRILARVVDAPDLDGRLRALWTDSVAPDPAFGDDWFLLELELWMHAVRDPVIADHLAARYADARRGLGAALGEWAAAEGLAGPDDPERAGALVIAVLLGLAMQQRIDPGAVSTEDALAGLRALLEGGRP